MKKTLLLTLTAGAVIPALAGHGQIYIDFGNDSSYRGVSVVNPDENGNHWNSVHSGAFYADLIDVNGAATTVDFGFSSAGGTDYFNGPSGGTEDPTETVYDAVALGVFGADEAVYDYYVNSTFQIQGLDPAKSYDLSFFGSHKYNTDNTTVYTVYTDNTYSTEVTSVSLEVGVGGAHNQDTIATLTGISPQSNGIIYVGFEGSAGNNGYLNAMSVAVPEPSTMAAVLGALVMVGVALRRRRR